MNITRSDLFYSKNINKEKTKQQQKITGEKYDFSHSISQHVKCFIYRYKEMYLN